MAHPYASQAKASSSRRMKAIGHYAGGGRVAERFAPKKVMARSEKHEDAAIPGEKMKAKKFARGGSVKGKKGTQVNVIIAGHGDGAKPPMPAMPMPAAAPPAPPPMPAGPPPGMAKPPMAVAPPGAMPPGLGPRPFKRGGAVKAMKHDDAKEDRAMIKSMVKPSAIKRADGGKVPAPMTAGSESGEGRMQKAKMAKK